MFIFSNVSVRYRLESGKICKNNNHTCLFHCINTLRTLVLCLTTRPDGLVFKQGPRARQMLMHKKHVISISTPFDPFEISHI